MTILEADEGLEERREQAKRAHRKLYARLLIMMFSLFKLKNPCFAEEKEWRLLSYVTRGPDPQDDMLRLCSFRATERGIVPYIPVKLADLGQRIINEVIIGPANLTPPEHVSAFLVANGIEGVAVRKSQASYR